VVALVPSSASAGRLAILQKLGTARRQSTVLRQLLSLILTFLVALLAVISVEWVARGELTDIAGYFISPIHPGFTTVGIVILSMLLLDAIFGRAHQSILLVAPLVLVPAFISNQKQHYLSDPLYPSDFLFARQIMELMPVIVRERPWTAVAVVIGIVASTTALGLLWRYAWRHAATLSRNARITRLSICLPLLAVFVSQMDPTQNSFIREKLRIIPIVWDQKENYGYNGFIIAFSLNLPMSKRQRVMGKMRSTPYPPATMPIFPAHAKGPTSSC
jgi:phosphoglycerol transferase MdoB-like AlkP superfamily enzyme